MGLELEIICLSFFLWTGVTFASFHWSGNIPVSRIFSNMILRGTHKCWPQSFTIFADIRSGPCAFLTLSPLIIAFISARLIWKVFILLMVWKRISGKTLSLAKGVHCEEKKSLKIEAFSLQLVIYLSSTSKGGILGILHLFKNLFRIFQ